MVRVLILYSTTDGQTLKICERLRERIEAQGQQAELVSIEAAGQVDLASFDKVVIGARIRYGHHSRLVHAFVDARLVELEARPSAFFSVNVTARKPEKNRPETNPYVRQFLRQVRWRPTELDVFAGKLDYPRYGPFDRWMIRLIMWLTNGPADGRSVVEFTDWQRVDQFAERIVRMRTSPPALTDGPAP